MKCTSSEMARKFTCVRPEPPERNRKMFTKIGLLAILVGAVATTADTKSPLTTVPSVDLQRYLGTWYEVARYPNRFEADCVSDVTANYSIRADGKVQVVNACRKADGEIKQSKGYAKIVQGSNNAKLRVTFFWPFFGDYWIVDLDPNYRYAVVSEPKREYLWILSRTPVMDEKQHQAILQRIRELGFDPNRLIIPKQTQK